MIREIQHTLRRLRGSPMFTIAATLTMAITIGATASVFAVVDGVLLKAFPYRDPARVLGIWESSPERGQPQFVVTPADYLDWRAQTRAFSALAATRAGDVTVTGKQEAHRVAGLAVTPSYFSALGITPALGRGLAVDSSGPSEVVIGYGYWQQRYGGAESALGQTLLIDDRPFTIVGVMPAGLPGDVALWTRLSFTATEAATRDSHQLQVYGRLGPGVTPEGGQAALQAIAGRLADAYPRTNENWTVVTIPLIDQLVGPVRPALIMLLCAAACVLLIGAANLANLFLVRCLAREREMALRTALGATRRRLVRELLAEATMLGLAAGTLGVASAVAGVRALRALAPSTLPRLSEVGVDGRVIAFCALTSAATILVFGLLPAWRVTRGSLADVLKAGGRGTGAAQSRALQDALVVLQVAVALTLLTGAGLLVESFSRFERMDPGFRPDGVLTAQVALSAARYGTLERQEAFASTVIERLDAQPGVKAASVGDALPGAGTNINAFAIIGDPPPDPSHVPLAYAVGASPDYFRTMGIHVLRGRALLPTDDSRARKVAVVDDLLVRRFFSGREAIGQRFVLRDTPTGPDTIEIVGVVATVEQGGLAAQDLPELYAPLAQYHERLVNIAVRTSGDPNAQTATLRRVVAGVDAAVPISSIRTMNAWMAQSIGTTRFSTFLASLFAAVALVLGMVGIYSVLAYVVSQRQREIGIQLALGASPSRVMGGVLRQALRLTGSGMVLGAAASWMLTRGLAGLFVGVSPHDPRIFGGAAAVFAVVALAAASVPAFRTTRVNPVVALASSP